MIPGFLITLVTFPGVIVHELAHALFCRLFGLEIYEVKYFQFALSRGTPSGYVIHKVSDKPWQNVLVGVGPFIVNSFLGAMIAAPAAIPVLRFEGGDLLDLFLMWLGVSIAMHAFPSTGDAKSIWAMATSEDTPATAKVLAIPIVGLIYVGAIGSFFWLDALWGLFVAGLVPELLIRLLA